eukprot:5443276-Amphidinium_carterae.5
MDHLDTRLGQSSAFAANEPPPPPPPPSSPAGPTQKAAKPPPSVPQTPVPKKGPPTKGPPKTGAPAKGPPMVAAYTSMPISTGSPPPPPPKPSASPSAGANPPPPPVKPKPPPSPPQDVQAAVTGSEYTVYTFVCDLPWDNRNVTEESKSRMIRVDPQLFREPQGMEVDSQQALLWRVANREEFPARPSKLVEDYLSQVRSKNKREKEEIVDIALRLKHEYWSANTNRNFEILQEDISGVIAQQYLIPGGAKLSPKGKTLPAEDHRNEVLVKINNAMRNLQETRTNGIVLLTGGTGTGKSSVIPPAYVCETYVPQARMRNCLIHKKVRQSVDE